jgi:L-asparaginase / beta-aspartyl-peptidase
VTIALIVHGGAGKWLPGADLDANAGTTAAVAVGRKILESGGSAIDAACAAAVVLEDNPIFNAGTGAVLNFDGICELDACVMESSHAAVGAVCALQRVKNPILVARRVMEETDHVLLAGEGAQRFARAMGFPDYDPETAVRRAEWREKRSDLDKVLGAENVRAFKMSKFLKDHPEYAGGTIGAVALDKSGVLCAATSTGGVTLKMAGRVGDTPLSGAGTYASRFAAVSATGTGEFVIRSLASRRISDYVQQGKTAGDAIRMVLDQLVRDFGAEVGFIAIDIRGDTAAGHRTQDMPHAYFSGTGEVVARMRALP